MSFDEKLEQILDEFAAELIPDPVSVIKQLISETIGEAKPQNTCMRLSKYEKELRHAFNLNGE